MNEPAKKDTKKVAFTVRLTPETAKDLDRRLAVVDLSRSSWVEAVITWALLQPVGQHSIVKNL